MNYEKLTALLSNSPTVRLLRAKNAPLILSFLHREFKGKNRLMIPNDELVISLSDYLEALNFLDEDYLHANFQERSKRYIDDWCNEDSRYLRKFPDETGVSVHELTSAMEKAFQWIESLEKKEFIGTESRFLDILRKLRELIENSSENPNKRIAELERKKRSVEAQIREIQISGKADAFSDTQVKERFHEITKLGRELISDFKEVEQNFKDITRNIYEKQTRRNISKGEILAYTLDATDELRNSDQGRSFDSFWRFLIAEYKQDELTTLIEDVFRILEEKEISNPDPFILEIRTYLHQAGQQVINSNHRLTEKLSRILGEKFLLDRKKTIELIADIKKLAMKRIEYPPKMDPFIEIEGNCNIHIIMDRPLGEPSQGSGFIHQPDETGDNEISGADLEKLFNPFEIDREMLKHNIEVHLEKHSQVTLDEIVRYIPLENGLAELVTYLSIASASPRHIIDNENIVEIEWIDNDIQKKVKMPQVIYGKQT